MKDNSLMMYFPIVNFNLPFLIKLFFPSNGLSAAAFILGDWNNNHTKMFERYRFNKFLDKIAPPLLTVRIFYVMKEKCEYLCHRFSNHALERTSELWNAISWTGKYIESKFNQVESAKWGGSLCFDNWQVWKKNSIIYFRSRTLMSTTEFKIHLYRVHLALGCYYVKKRSWQILPVITYLSSNSFVKLTHTSLAFSS